ncbi:MAG: hypothetical protein ACRC28_04070 [Clostridium sp.]|uniref:hypothetical protein n=1 Tax=Clostridium sp. TaxID=1506 RepID=UPI003F2EA1CB
MNFMEDYLSNELTKELSRIRKQMNESQKDKANTDEQITDTPSHYLSYKNKYIKTLWIPRLESAHLLFRECVSKILGRKLEGKADAPIQLRISRNLEGFMDLRTTRLVEEWDQNIIDTMYGLEQGLSILYDRYMDTPERKFEFKEPAVEDDKLIWMARLERARYDDDSSVFEIVRSGPRERSMSREAEDYLKSEEKRLIDEVKRTSEERKRKNQRCKYIYKCTDGCP